MGTWLWIPIFLLCAVLNQEGDAVCCEKFYDTITFWDTWTYVCADGKPPTGTSPACGKGGCNFFGCNCEGGCRGGQLHRVGSPDAIRFVCDYNSVPPDSDLETFLAHPQCSCLINRPHVHYVASKMENVTGPEAVFSSPLICEAGVESCTLEVTHVAAYEVTTSVSSRVSVGLPSDVLRHSLGFEVTWATTTGTETTFTCSVKGGSEVRLTVKPEYFKMKLVENSHLDEFQRPRCKLSTYFVPQITGDKSIKGARRCAVRPLQKAKADENQRSGGITINALRPSNESEKSLDCLDLTGKQCLGKEKGVYKIDMH